MTLLEVIKERHTVRSYNGQAITGEIDHLKALIADANRMASGRM